MEQINNEVMIRYFDQKKVQQIVNTNDDNSMISFLQGWGPNVGHMKVTEEQFNEMYEENNNSIQEEITQRNFAIPRQCHFPPENEPSSGAIIRYQGHDWAIVVDGEQCWHSDSLGAMYTCLTQRHQPRRGIA